MLTYSRSGVGRPLVFVHGFLGGAGVWRGQLAGLKDGFDMVAVDLPGFAGSPMGSAPETMSGFVAEVMALADALEFRRFSLVGWSFGGMIAQQAALEHPQRIERLVLAGTAGVGELPRRFETWSETLSRIRRTACPPPSSGPSVRGSWRAMTTRSFPPATALAVVRRRPLQGGNQRHAAVAGGREAFRDRASRACHCWRSRSIDDGRGFPSVMERTTQRRPMCPPQKRSRSPHGATRLVQRDGQGLSLW